MGSLKVQTYTSPDGKISPFGRPRFRTEEDPPEISGRTFDDAPDSARKMVNYSQNNFVRINVAKAQNNKFAMSSANLELPSTANEQSTLGLHKKPNIRLRPSRRLIFQPNTVT